MPRWTFRTEMLLQKIRFPPNAMLLMGDLAEIRKTTLFEMRLAGFCCQPSQNMF